MVFYIAQKLAEMDCEYIIDGNGNIIVYKGAPPYPCICSHLDTVHEIHNDFQIKSNYKHGFTKIYALSEGKQVGIGGDDKCGVFSCLTALKFMDNVMVVFFSKEEAGTIGADNIDLDLFDGVQYLIEPDRKGSGDWINSYFGCESVSKEFDLAAKPILQEFGYKEAQGIYTDIMMIYDKLQLSAVNISCGYYNAHTDNEFINYSEFINSLTFLFKLIECLRTDTYPVYPPVSPTRKGYYDNKYNYREANSYQDYFMRGNSTTKTAVCSCCGIVEDADEIFYASTEPICIDCIQKYNLWTSVDEEKEGNQESVR